MPRQARSYEQIEAVKDEIRETALDLITRNGLEGFSMRKLGSKMGIAAKTVYNYYRSKDEIYLNIVIEGFRTLYDKCEKAGAKANDPLEKLQLMSRAYLDFGLGAQNFYNLMFTWHTPKYEDYVETELEPVAKIELTVSLELYELFLAPVREIAASAGVVSDVEEQARFYVVFFWSLLHGFIAGHNNTMLSYMHEDPAALKEAMLDLAVRTMGREVDNWTKGR